MKPEEMTWQMVIDKVNLVLDHHHLNRLEYKARTHGGQWDAPCPRCKILTGDGGTNRLRIHPYRPVYGSGSRDEPLFVCRICKRPDDPTKPWSGDLLEFVREAMQMNLSQARAWLGWSAGKVEIKPRRLEPTISFSGAPCLEWQQEGMRLVNAAEEFLWSKEGEKARQAIMKGRGLTEEVLREAHIGWQDDPALFCDGAAWGLEGRMRIERGIVIPEYHRGVHGEIELWSIALRRPKEVLDDEEFNYTPEEIARGKKAQRYKLVRGSQKSLYGAESIKKGQIVVLNEGQINALSVAVAARKEFAFAATQGAESGQADPRILGYWLSIASGVLLMMDPDNAGQKAYEFWSQALAERSIDHRPLSGDINDMLVKKGPDAVYDFLSRGRRKLEKMFSFAVGSVAIPVPENQQTASDNADAPEHYTRKTEPLTAFSDRVLELQAQLIEKGKDVSEMGFLDIMGESLTEKESKLVEITPIQQWHELMDKLAPECRECNEPAVMYDAQGGGWCQRHRPDKTANMCDYNGCQGEVAYRNEAGYGWCRMHFASFQLMEEGEKMRAGSQWNPYLSIRVEAGQGIIQPGIWREDGTTSSTIWGKAARFQIFQGEQKFCKFARSADPAQIWLAAREVHLVNAGTKKRRPAKEVEVQCSRFDCFNDATVDIRVFWDTHKDGPLKGQYKYPDLYKGYIVHTQEHGKLPFCGVCTDAAYLLEMVELLGYPRWGASPNEVEEGEDSWVRFCVGEDLFKVGAMFSSVKEQRPEIWKEALDIIHAV